MVAQVESIQKQLNLLSIQIGQMEQRAIGDEDPTDKTEEKATLLEQEMPKRLKEGVEEYKNNASFDMDATITCTSTLMVGFSLIEEDFHAI